MPWSAADANRLPLCSKCEKPPLWTMSRLESFDFFQNSFEKTAFPKFTCRAGGRGLSTSFVFILALMGYSQAGRPDWRHEETLTSGTVFLTWHLHKHPEKKRGKEKQNGEVSVGDWSIEYFFFWWVGNGHCEATETRQKQIGFTELKTTDDSFAWMTINDQNVY